MKDYTSDNPAFSDKISIVERADLVNWENKTKSEKQLLQNDLVLKARMDKYLGSDDNSEGPEFVEGIEAEDVVGAINEVFQLGSEKKKQLVENLTALGITASTGETWEMLLGKVLDLIDPSKDTVTAETLLSGYTAHNAAGTKITGTLADKTGTADYNAEASIDGTNKRIKLKVPATGKYGVGNYLYAAYTTIANLIGLTAAKLVKGNTILGITGSNNNMDTSGADAGAGDVLAGKKAGVKGSLITGTMPNKGAWTGATTGNGNVTIPAGYHNGQGHVSGAGAYNAGVSAADGRVNADSANYRGGYNAGVSATKKGTAGAGDVLSGKTFTNGSSVGASGTMPNKGAWTGATTGSGNVAIPAGYHNGQGHVSGAGAYNKGVTDADARVNANSANYKGGYNAGVSATKKGTAGAGDVLSGKTFTNGSIVEASGTMANKGSTTQDATATQDDTYTYLAVPVAGYYNTASKLRTKNSNLQQKFYIPNPFWLCVTGVGNFGNGTAVGGVSGIWLDLTNVKKLTFDNISVSGSPSTHSVSIRSKHEGHYGSDDEIVCSVVLNNGSTAELDVSNLTGVYYLVLAASAKPTSGYKTYKISTKCTIS